MKNPFRKRQSREVNVLPEQFKRCSHVWKQIGKSEYSECACSVMRHDNTNEDLIELFVYDKPRVEK